MAKNKSIGLITLACYRYITHHRTCVPEIIRDRDLPVEVTERALQIRLQFLSTNVNTAVDTISKVFDLDNIKAFTNAEYGGAECYPTLSYFAELLPAEERTSLDIKELLMRAHLSEDVYFYWGMKALYDVNKFEKRLGQRPTNWSSTGNPFVPLATLNGTDLVEARVCAFPFEPLYSIALNSKHEV